MKIDITYRNINKESHESTRNAIEQITERHLTPKLSTFHVGHLELHVTVEQTTKKDYCVTYRLHLPPKKILVAKECHHDLRTSIQEVTSELTRQAKRHRAHVSGRQNWKRKGRDKRIEALYADIQRLQPTVEPKTIQETIAPLQPRLEEYIRHELTYLRNNGDLLPDYPSLADIRDEAVARLHIDWHELDSSDEVLYKRLLREVTSILSQEIEQTRIAANQVSLDDTVQPDAMDQAEAMVGEESEEFYQPDEVLHIQDLIPDTHALTPEVSSEGYHDHFYRYLAGLPILWRRTIMLVHKEKLSVDDVAQHILFISVDEVKRMLVLADLYIYERLREAGFTPPMENTTEMFLRHE
ncbi:MAG TPA: hypothetical protein ENI84_01855 [Thiothrix sp.]|nr:hypothetical protein [Thiothrix sp.]